MKERNRGKPLAVQDAEPKPDEQPPSAKKPTYRQDWANHNAAQTNEKWLFQALLADLCDTITAPPVKTGRPLILRRDSVFATVFKVHSAFGGRRFSSGRRGW